MSNRGQSAHVYQARPRINKVLNRVQKGEVGFEVPAPASPAAEEVKDVEAPTAGPQAPATGNSANAMRHLASRVTKPVMFGGAE